MRKLLLFAGLFPDFDDFLTSDQSGIDARPQAAENLQQVR